MGRRNGEPGGSFIGGWHWEVFLIELFFFLLILILRYPIALLCHKQLDRYCTYYNHLHYPKAARFTITFCGSKGKYRFNELKVISLRIFILVLLDHALVGLFIQPPSLAIKSSLLFRATAVGMSKEHTHTHTHNTMKLNSGSQYQTSFFPLNPFSPSSFFKEIILLPKPEPNPGLNRKLKRAEAEKKRIIDELKIHGIGIDRTSISRELDKNKKGIRGKTSLLTARGEIEEFLN